MLVKRLGRRRPDTIDNIEIKNDRVSPVRYVRVCMHISRNGRSRHVGTRGSISMFVPPGGDGGRGAGARTRRGALYVSRVHLPICRRSLSPCHRCVVGVPAPVWIAPARRRQRRRVFIGKCYYYCSYFRWPALVRRLLYHTSIFTTTHVIPFACSPVPAAVPCVSRAAFSRRVRGLRRTRLFVRYVSLFFSVHSSIDN